MGLYDYDTIDSKQNNEIVRLGYKDTEDIKELISISYPDYCLEEMIV